MKNTLRFTLALLMVAGLAGSTVSQANWLTKLGARTHSMAQQARTSKLVQFIKNPKGGIHLSGDSWLGKYIIQKMDQKFGQAAEPTMVSAEEVRDFKCPKKSMFCVKGYKSSGQTHIKDYFGKVSSERTEEKSVFCTKCNIHLKSVETFSLDSNREKVASIENQPKNYVDAECEVVNVPKIKALAVTSIPANGFWVRCKEMLIRK